MARELFKRYVALGNWSDKETGLPRSSLGEISEGINKSGKPYQITNTENTVIVDENYPVGTILSGAMTLTSDKAVSAPVSPVAPVAK